MKRTHGLSGSLIYLRFRAMHDRCSNPNAISFKNYGARGIKVCERWAKFENFLADMGMPKVGEELDRIDNDGNYSLSNCRWVSLIIQANNTRANKHVTIGNETKTLAEWSRISGIKYGLIQARLSRGWDTHDAVWKKAGIPGNYYRPFICHHVFGGRIGSTGNPICGKCGRIMAKNDVANSVCEA